MKENDDDVKRVSRERMILAGDIGATKTLLGLFEPGPVRPRPGATESFATADYPDLAPMLAAFLKGVGAATGSLSAAAFGLAGPVLGDTAHLTNAASRIDGPDVAARLGLKRVDLLNDLQAMACSVPVLDDTETLTLQSGESRPEGNMALIAAGTGLGEALLHRVGGTLVASPSEAGHADFAARNEREIRALRWLIATYGRADVESVVSGPGLLNLHRVVHAARCQVVDDLASPGAPAAVAQAALDGRCDRCREALEMFVEAYGAEAGNLALRALATAGVFVGGGIAPKILPALTDGRFVQAFRSKGSFEPLLAAMPLKVILNPQAGLLGAAVYAARQR